MRLPKWRRKRKGKNPFEGSLIVDNPDIKVVEAKYDSKPVLLAIGTSKQRELKISGKGNAEGLRGKYQTQKDLKWEILYNPKALPGFIPIEKAKDLMAGTIAVTSGSAAVYEPQTKISETTDQWLKNYFAKSWLVPDEIVKEVYFSQGRILNDADLIIFKKEEEKKTKKDKSKQDEER
jgi:hypothetical protein